jgi:hypothetical protein
LAKRTSTRRRGALSKQRRRMRRRRGRMKYSYLGSRPARGSRSRRAGRKGRPPRELACERHKEARRSSAPRLVMMFMRRMEAPEAVGSKEPWRRFRSRLHTLPASLSCHSPSPPLTSLPARRPPIPSLAQAAAAAVAAAARGETAAAHTRIRPPSLVQAAAAAVAAAARGETAAAHTRIRPPRMRGAAPLAGLACHRK